MKATLHENPLERYETVYEGQKLLEISGEMVVPDKMPDIGLLGEASAHVLLHSKRVASGCGGLEGDVSASVFYTPDGGTGFHVLRMQLPWGMEFESDNIMSGSQAVCRVCVVHLETRMLNPRKIILKAKLHGTLTVYEQKRTSVCDRIEENAVIQVRQNTVECSVVSTVCEKTFVATDEYPLPPDLNGGEVIGKTVQFRAEDVKTLSNKLIVKGSVLSDVIIAAENGAVERLSFTSAFSLIAETDCEQVSDNVLMSIMPTAMYYELNANGNVLSVEVHAVCQMTVYETVNVTYLSDAYSNFHPFMYEWDEVNVYQNVKRMLHRESVTGSITCRSQPSSVRFLMASHTWNEGGGETQISILVGAFVQYENGGTDWVKTQLTLPLEMKERECLQAVRLGDLYAAVSGMEIEFRMTCDWESMELSTALLKHINEVTWDEKETLEHRKASFTLSRGGALWDLARKYGSTVELIRRYNQLDDNEENAYGVLLIPTQRK